MNIPAIREQFPILHRNSQSGMPLIYLDSAATSQKPNAVIDAMQAYYRHHNANIHRGIHTLAEEATSLYESARETTAQFIGASSADEIVFTRNTTEALNLVAQAWGGKHLKEGDLVILTEMEHHANLVPWQMLAERKNLRLEFIPFDEQGVLDLAEYARLLEQSPKLVSFTHISNVLGTHNPAEHIITQAKSAGAVTVLDAAQSVAQIPINVQALGIDFMAFSAHKMCGPTGIGVLYGKAERLAETPPLLGGGGMIRRVRLRSFEPADVPARFEAGTPAIAEAIGMAAAMRFLAQIGMEEIHQHEQMLTRYAWEKLSEVPGLRLLGPASNSRGGLTTFVMEEIHAHDLAQELDRFGIAVRAGHHCTMPLHNKLGISASVRASFYLYNTFEEIDHLVLALFKAREWLG
jgi:cysteine desulfurase/selenocysteine lyase